MNHSINHTRSYSQLLTTLTLSLACLIGMNSLPNEATAERQVTQTTTTTKKVSRRTTRKSSARRNVTKRATHRDTVSRGAVASRRYSRRSSHRSYYHSRPAVVRHRSSRSGVTSSNSGFTNSLLFEVGGSVFAPLKGEVTSGLQLAVGSRLGPIGGLIETQFAQDQEGARMSDLNAQLRIYLPLGDHAEVYPLLALGQANLLSSRSASHLDLGIGAQFNVNRHLAVGARYSARLIADKVNGDPTNGHNLTAQIAVRF